MKPAVVYLVNYALSLTLTLSLSAFLMRPTYLMCINFKARGFGEGSSSVTIINAPFFSSLAAAYDQTDVHRYSCKCIQAYALTTQFSQNVLRKITIMF